MTTDEEVRMLILAALVELREGDGGTLDGFFQVVSLVDPTATREQVSSAIVRAVTDALLSWDPVAERYVRTYKPVEATL